MSVQSFSKTMAMIFQPVHFLVRIFGRTELATDQVPSVVRMFGTKKYQPNWCYTDGLKSRVLSPVSPGPKYLFSLT